nr:MAG TPA: hypothetical protein [Caudoviricetes sp.]
MILTSTIFTKFVVSEKISKMLKFRLFHKMTLKELCAIMRFQVLHCMKGVLISKDLAELPIM